MHHTRTAESPIGSTIQSALVSFPIACFTLTLLTDLAYYATSNLMWQNFSSWLLLAGQIGGGLAVIGWIALQAVHRGKPKWSIVVLNLIVLVTASFNSLVHAGDGWTAIVPWGITLSAITVVLMLISAFLGATTHRR